MIYRQTLKASDALPEKIEKPEQEPQVEKLPPEQKNKTSRKRKAKPKS